MAVKRQLVHTSKAVTLKLSTVGLHNGLRGKYHRHFCADRDCRLFYEDHCDEPEVNGRCQHCRGTSRAHAAVMDPQECCIDNCKQVLLSDDLLRYQLAGPGPWFQCKTCARTHGWPCSTT